MDRHSILEMLVRRSRSSHPAGGIPTDYVFYAPFKADAGDYSPDARTANLFGTSPSYSTVDGVPCATFPASSGVDYGMGSMATGDHHRTLSIWIKASNISESNCVYYYAGYSSARQTIHLGQQGGKMEGNTWTIAYSPSYTMDTNWHHYVIRYNASGHRLDFFVDGVSIASNSSTITFPDTSHISIGGSYQASYKPTGQTSYAAARIYDRALTTNEITALYNEDFSDSSDSSSSGGSDSSSSGGSPEPAGPTDYVFRAPLATSLDDVSASARTGTAAGGTATTGEVKDGVICTYIPQSVKVTWPIGDVVLGSSPRTVSLWFWTPSINSSWNTMFCYGSDSEHYKLYAMGYHQSGQYAFTAYWNDLDSGIGTATASKWHNFTVSYDGTDIKAYVDGVFKKSKTTSDIDTATSDITVGARSYNSNEYAGNMWFADIRIYNRALSASEVAALASQIN